MQSFHWEDFAAIYYLLFAICYLLFAICSYLLFTISIIEIVEKAKTLDLAETTCSCNCLIEPRAILSLRGFCSYFSIRITIFTIYIYYLQLFPLLRLFLLSCNPRILSLRGFYFGFQGFDFTQVALLQHFGWSSCILCILCTLHSVFFYKKKHFLSKSIRFWFDTNSSDVNVVNVNICCNWSCKLCNINDDDDEWLMVRNS